VAGAVLFIILVFVLQTVLFLTVYRYNSSVQEAIKTENERIQEKIVLSSLRTDNSTGVENIHALQVNNTGAITVRIRAIYIDNQFLCDPSAKSINPDDTYVNPKETSWVLMPSGVKYNKDSTITAATERGTKSTDLEGRLKQGGEGRPPYESHKFYLGPLMLDFTKFYYAEVYPQTAALTSEWRPGWSISAGTGTIAWNITVKNIDDRNITINQFSSFTLWPNDEPSSRRPWYIEPPPNSLTQRINVNETAEIIYKWTTPKTNQTKNPNTQSIYTTECRCRTILTFFGIFHELDGTTKPYGQTIPFEAVLVEKAPIIQVTAWPTVIATNVQMASTITAVMKIGGNPVVGANLTFTTSAGSLSASWAITDATGTARVYLTAGALPATAIVTATWKAISSSTTVSFETATIQVTASPAVIATNSTMNSTITTVVKLGANPYAGANVAFTTTAGSLSAQSAITDVNGIAKVYLTAGMLPENATVTATWITITDSEIVRFTNLYVITDRQSYARNDTVKISGLLRNVNGMPIQGAVISINIAASNGTIIWSVNTNPTDSDGLFTYDLQLIDATPDTYTILATYQAYEERYCSFVVS